MGGQSIAQTTSGGINSDHTHNFYKKNVVGINCVIIAALIVLSQAVTCAEFGVSWIPELLPNEGRRHESMLAA